MRAAVRKAFIAFTERFEGFIPWMYLDAKGLVTIGLGNLIDPVVSPTLDFYRKSDKESASVEDIRAEWAFVKGLTALKGAGGGHFEEYTKLEATRESIEELVWGELAHFEYVLKGWFPDFEEWPADAQLGLLSMAWAMGPYFVRSWPHFRGACEAWQWELVATPRGTPESCQMNEARQPREFRQRNAANLLLFGNAAVVAAQEIDPEPLQWPLVLRG